MGPAIPVSNRHLRHRTVTVRNVTVGNAAHRASMMPNARSSTARPPRSGAEIRSLTGLRLVAALWVVALHFQYVQGVGVYGQFLGALEPLVVHGSLGVDLFFVLSGFVITLTYLDKLGPRPVPRAMVTFWWARICRVWPVYALLTALFGIWLIVKGSRDGDGAASWQNVQP